MYLLSTLADKNAILRKMTSLTGIALAVDTFSYGQRRKMRYPVLSSYEERYSEDFRSGSNKAVVEGTDGAV